MRRFIKRLRDSEVGRSIGVLASGAFLAQAVYLLSSPALTRLYEPTSFAILGLFMAFISSLAPGISGRYEVAVAVAQTREESRSLFVIATWTTALMCAMVFLLLLFFAEPIRNIFNAGSLGHWLYLVPVGLFFFGMIMALRYYANGQKDYKRIGRLSIGQAATTTVFSVLFGVIGQEQIGLIAATILGYAVTIVFMFAGYRRDLLCLDYRLNADRRELALRYKQFPLFNAPTSVLDGITLSMAVFFLTRDYPGAVVGYFALLNRVATAPLGFVAQAVSQVHLRKVADLVQAAKSVKNYLTKITLLLTVLGSIPAAIFLLAAPEIFAFVFGEQWREAGQLLTILVPALTVKFVVSPLSGVFASTGNNHLAAAWKVLAFIVTLGMFLIFSGRVGVQEIFLAMMVTDVILYALYYLLIWKAISYPRGTL